MESDEEVSRKQKRTNHVQDSGSENGKTINVDLNIKVFSFRGFVIHLGHSYVQEQLVLIFWINRLQLVMKVTVQTMILSRQI